MKKTVLLMGFAAITLAGCTGGTTYGTGTSHEAATIKSLGSMLSLKKEKKNITYNSRPELVMPANKNILPQPVKQQALGVDQEWPETPEQRIANVSGAAPAPDYNNRSSGSLPVEYITDTNKPGIRNSARLHKNKFQNPRATSVDFIKAIKDDANGVGESQRAREAREQISFSTGVKRKFLTEPPTEYRTPSENAEAGDLGITKEALTAREKAAAKDKINESNGVLTPRGANE